MDSVKNMISVWGGLLGAYFGFVFFRLGQDLSERKAQIREIKMKLAKILYLLNEVSSISSDSKLGLRSLKRGLDGPFSFIKFSFEEIPRIPIDIVVEINSEKLMNDLYKFNDKIRRANHNLTITSSQYEEIKNSHFAGRVSDMAAMENIRLMISAHQPIMDAHLEDLVNEGNKLFSEVRAWLNNLKKRKYFVRGAEPTAGDIQREHTQLLRELETNST